MTAFLSRGYKQDLLDTLSRLRRHLKKILSPEQYHAALVFIHDELETDISVVAMELRNKNEAEGPESGNEPCQ